MRTYLSLIFLSIFLNVCPCYTQKQQLPFTILQIGEWGEEGNLPGQLKEPEALSIDPAGCLYIADTGNHRIQKFTITGDFITQVGGFGWDTEQFDTPVSITSRNGLDVFVSDHYNGRIKRYDKDLHLISVIDLNTNSDSQYNINYPGSVYQSSFGELYCLDIIENRAIKFTIDGKPQSIIGSINSGDGRLRNPNKIFIDSRNDIYILDQGNLCIKVYDMHGNFLLNIGEGFFKSPCAMIELKDGLFLIADKVRNDLSLFSRENRLIGTISDVSLDLNIADMALYRDMAVMLYKTKNSVIIFRIQPSEG